MLLIRCFRKSINRRNRRITFCTVLLTCIAIIALTARWRSGLSIQLNLDITVINLLDDQQHMLSSDQRNRLNAIKSGLLTSKDIEIVLSRHGEDISWSDMYSSIRTIYDKSDNYNGNVSGHLPPSTAGKVVVLPNLGRESYTYLRHIVDNYDTLASVTVFSQASEPTHGYSGHRKGGGHLMSNSSFHDFVLSPTGHFIFTGAVWLPSLAHLLRSGMIWYVFGMSCMYDILWHHITLTYLTSHDFTSHHITVLQTLLALMMIMSAHSTHTNDVGYNRVSATRSQAMQRCPTPMLTEPGGSEYRFDLEEKNHFPLLQHIASRCTAENSTTCTGYTFWKRFVKLPLPKESTMFFSQGATFSVTSKQIRTRPLEDYRLLLREVSKSEDPSAGFFLEWMWYYVLTSDISPCPLNGHEFDWALVQPYFKTLDLPSRISFSPLRVIELLKRPRFTKPRNFRFFIF